MSIDIGRALRDGVSRTAAKNGLIVAAIFAGIARQTTVLMQSLVVAGVELILETFQSLSPQEIGVEQAEYDQALAEFETAREDVRSTAALALEIPVRIAIPGLILLGLLGEAAAIVAVRVFATEQTETIPRELVTDNIILATLNGVVGKIIVVVLILLGLALLVLPGIILAVLFFFLRQEIAINDKNFVQAMADSWRITRGNRIEVFVIGAALLIVSQFEAVTASALELVSTTAGAIGAALVGGLLTAFGAAVATRAYIQIDEDAAQSSETDAGSETDPYDAALGPDDLSR
jgi:hypothetical protein